MIDLKYQWAIQIDCTNVCRRGCSNCTRMVGHVRKPFFMPTRQFERAVIALKDFPTASPKSAVVDDKVVGLLGGEPLLHPKFDELAEIMAKHIPRRENRGLWTAMDWRNGPHAAVIEKTFGYVNNNLHNRECLHSPILVAINDVIPEGGRRTKLISYCWLQRLWSGTITPKGFFFCEVAGAMDGLFGGPGGLPVEPGCWQRPLKDFREQIDRWCGRCGIPLNLLGRRDNEGVDDISLGNLADLAESPRVKAGKYVVYDGNHVTTAQPWKYLR